MPDIQPPELAALLDLAERPRTGGWSLRAALTRYAQGQPQRVADLLELVRRIQAAIGSELAALERAGPERWQQVAAGVDDGSAVLALLLAMREIDEVGEALATWAVDPWNRPRPDGQVDAVVASVTERLAAAGIPKEDRPGRPPRGRRSG